MKCLTLSTPLEVSVGVANAAVEVDLGVNVLAILSSDTAAQETALVDVNALTLGSVVEVGHLGWMNVVT